jgi:hypothetical protein
MADIKLKYGSSAQALTVSSLNSLAGGSYATSNEVDNSSDLFVDVMVEVTIADITEAGNKQAVVYAIDCIDGTNWSDNQSGNPQAMRLLGVVPMNGTGPWRSAAMSVAAAFGGVVPPKWKVVILNDNSTTALASSGNSVQYRGVQYQSV